MALFKWVFQHLAEIPISANPNSDSQIYEINEKDIDIFVIWKDFYVRQDYTLGRAFVVINVSNYVRQDLIYSLFVA